MKYQDHKKYINSMITGSFDICKREIKVKKDSYYLCFLNSLSDADQIVELIKGLYQGISLADAFSLCCASYSTCEDVSSAITSILSGQCIILYENDIYAVEVRHYPNQPSNEASNEQSIRGAHDSFVENIILNVGLMRRRIRDPLLQIKMMKCGNRTKTDIAYMYIEDLVNQDILNDFEGRLDALENVEVIYERSVYDALYGKSLNPYPSVRYCERPDICSIHLLQGYIVVLVDNCFTAMILPTTFFEMTKQIEEYTQTPMIAIFIRLIRLLAIFLSIYLLPFWLLVQTMQNPTILNIPIVETGNVYYLLFQVLTIECVVEWIRLSYIHTPNAINGIMSFLFIFLLGESAVNIKVYTEIILVIVILCNICNFVTPNYELSLANKLFRIAISILTVLGNFVGFTLGLFMHIFILLRTRNTYCGYLYPFIPFDYKEIKRLIIGTPIHFNTIQKHRRK